nr:MAG TPA: putative terminase small subunit [Caudoviricetes sp.]
MANKKKIPFDTIAQVYEKKAGNLASTASALNIDRTTLWKMRKENPILEERLKAIDEGLIDFAESKLLKAISEGNITGIIFFLKTKGKNRGYVERVEQDVNVNPFQELMESVTDEDELEN